VRKISRSDKFCFALVVYFKPSDFQNGIEVLWDSEKRPDNVCGTVDNDVLLKVLMYPHRSVGRGGNFELTIPDFTEDPVFRSNSFDYGFLILSLENERVEGTVGAFVSTDSNGSKRGLQIKTDYPDPVVCAPVH
jgi:hypothetical protein